MQLPEIPTGGVQDEASGGYRALGEAQGRFGDTVAQGITALHRELVKSQTTDATLDLTQSLATLKEDLRNKQSFDRGELEEVLGKEEFAKLPEQIRDRPEEPVLDEQGQQVLDGDRPAYRKGSIPAWQVAERVYDKKAQAAVDQAATRISAGSGWQDQFRQAARGDVIRQRSELVSAWTEQAGKHIANDRVRQAMTAALSGNWETANVIVDGSLEALGEEGQARLRQQVGTLQQLKPIEDSLIHWRSDPGSPTARAELMESSKALADEKRTGLLEPQRRAALDGQVRAALDEMDKGAKTHEAAGLALQIVQANPDPANPYKVDAASAQAALAREFAPGGRFADRPELFFEAGALVSKVANEQNQAAKQSYDGLAGGAIGQYLSLDRNGTPHPSYSNVTAPVRAALQASGKDGQELLKQMLDWDRQADMHERTRRNMPSDAEEARAFRVERSLALRPGEWRAMSGADQMAVLAGRKPIPGEPDAPAVAISAKDVPSLSTKIAGLSAPVRPVFVTDPAKIALEEATVAYPVLRNPKNSNAQARAALKGLSDKLADFITTEKNATGNEPKQDAIRNEARRLMQTVEVKDSFMWVFPSKKKVPRLEAEQKGLDYTEPEGPAAPPPPLVKPDRKTGEIVPSESLGYEPGGKFRLEPNGSYRRVE